MKRKKVCVWHGMARIQIQAIPPHKFEPRPLRFFSSFAYLQQLIPDFKIERFYLAAKLDCSKVRKKTQFTLEIVTFDNPCLVVRKAFFSFLLFLTAYLLQIQKSVRFDVELPIYIMYVCVSTALISQLRTTVNLLKVMITEDKRSFKLIPSKLIIKK